MLEVVFVELYVSFSTATGVATNPRCHCELCYILTVYMYYLHILVDSRVVCVQYTHTRTHVCMHCQDVSAMTEEDQLALALQMSMAGMMEEEEEDQQLMETGEQVEITIIVCRTSPTLKNYFSDSPYFARHSHMCITPSWNFSQHDADHTHTQGGGEEGDEDLMQNPEFLHSVLSSLPGVNPEEALHNLEQMTEQHREQDKDKDKVMVYTYRYGSFEHCWLL